MKNYGFIRPKRDKRNYHFGDGNLVGQMLRPDGQWDDYLPVFEAQSKNGFDTMNCWNFSTQKALKTLLIEQGFENKDIDYSERYICVLGNGTPNGGSPQAASEAIRTKGLIPNSMLPWTDNITNFWQFKQPNPMQQKYLDEGKKWLDKYSYGYDYVKTSYGVWLWRYVTKLVSGNKLSADQQQMLMDALHYSPIGAAVYAWVFDENNLAYKPSWASANHWIEVYGYVEGKYWKAYDNYNNMYIKLRWDYNFSFLMRYVVTKKNNNDEVMKTIKKKGDPKVYLASPTKQLIHIEGEKTYNTMIMLGYITPCTEVDSLDGYIIQDGLITIGL